MSLSKVISKVLPIPKDVFTHEDALKKFNKNLEELINVTNPDDPDFTSKVLSLPANVIKEIRKTLEKSSRFRNVPWIYGSCEINPDYTIIDKAQGKEQIKMVFADITTYDFFLLPIAFQLGPLGLLAIALPRLFYYFGRKQWWRHEGIHMAHYLMAAQIVKHKNPDVIDEYDIRSNSFFFVYESGLEELVTRWQSFKEGNGIREKIAGAIALLLYIEYLPFTGIRNFLIDLKKKIIEKLSKIRISPESKFLLKSIFYLSLLVIPEYLLMWYIPQNISIILPSSTGFMSNLLKITPTTLKNLSMRAGFWYMGAYLGMVFSEKRTGIKEWSNYHSVNQFKFPYTYNPFKALLRGIEVVRYLSYIWKIIPTYIEIGSKEEMESFLESLNKRVKEKYREITLKIVRNIIEDCLKEGKKEIYLKGLFIPYFYYYAKELFKKKK